MSASMLLAVEACERMRCALLGFADSHQHAASIARADWTGPHRSSFECELAAIQDELVRQAAFVSRLASAIEDAEGPR